MRYEYTFLSEYKNNEKYHHSEKGCEVECLRDQSGDYEFCHTHGVRCSKTGWEVGFYLGRQTNDLNIRAYPKKCAVCGDYFMTNTRLREKVCNKCNKAL